MIINKIKSSLSIALLMMACGCQNPDKKQAVAQHQSEGTESANQSKITQDQSEGTESAIQSKVTESAIQSFETAELPSWLSSDKNSRLQLSKEVFQHGENALLWEGHQDSFLQVDKSTPGLGIAEDVKEFRVWVYSEKAGGKLQIQAGDAQQFDDPQGTYQIVDYHLNFTGWRSLWIKFDEVGSMLKNGESTSLENKGEHHISAIRLQAMNKSSDRLYFDNLEVSDKSIPHGCLGNLQIPEIVNSLENRHNFPWVALKLERDVQEFQNFTYNEQALEQIMKRIKDVLANGIGKKSKAIQGYREFSSKVSTDSKGKTHGPAIYSHIVERYYRLKGFPGIHSSKLNGALAYCADKFIETGDESWGQLYISYLDFRSEKGYAFGSATMNRVFEAKNAANYLDSLIKMKDYIGEDRLGREAAEIRWMCGYNYLYSLEKEPVDADKILGDMQTLMVAIYLQPQTSLEDKKSKLYDFTKFQEIINLTMTPGVDSLERTHIVKPDYSIWHHGMEMTYSYGYAAAHRYMKYYYILAGSPAALEKDTAQGIISYYGDLFTAKGAGSYMGSRGNGVGHIQLYAEILAYATVSGVKGAKPILKAYLERNTFGLKDLPKDLQVYVREEVLNKPDLKAYDIVSGTHVRPFAATLVQHGKAYTAVIRGFNEDVSTSEIFLGRENAANIYGQQQNNGFLQLYSAEGPGKSGLKLNGGGWDWSLYPGATTLKMTTDQIEQELTHGKFKFEGETLSGGLAHFNKAGIYFQELNGGQKHLLKNLKGNKSWFFFEDLIVCLGSNIKLSGAKQALVTTLFQYHHDKKDQNLVFDTYIDGAHKIRQGVFAETPLAAKAVSISDPAGNSYYIPFESNVIIKRGLQKSRVPRAKNIISEGYVSTAWIDHGINPLDAGYEYTVLPQEKLEKYEAFNKRELYTVLQKDEKAHIVKNNKTIGYVVLEGGQLNKGPLTMSKNPLLLMLSQEAELMRLGLADPQLNLELEKVSGNQRSIAHSIRLKGVWNKVKCLNNPEMKIQLSVVNNETVLSLNCINGESYDLELNK
ncbi:polysaccharide lyase family 8 super-sandwich domain-containing protein [Lentisphaera profundi]|uniref:Polysaccharide lyase family 8 super-sandwich domain-containing protein n=1 Tax=Lentisphaera profundi TaxID=1658616 RepID=A0ABY7VPK2_9BACT|nr:polysaccharide lyase family 8 super-sandwich domain-containing protein [Lentisphaera profundi]WDE95219.1 polysaccharide lyase family 8 super-sandwich domain-containing protein [Lentisphaera profundi]